MDPSFAAPELNVLQPYCNYLLRQQFSDCSKEFLPLARQFKLPLLNHLSPSEEEALLQLAEDFLKCLLQNLEKGKEALTLLHQIKIWKAEHLPEVWTKKIGDSDILIICTTYRHIFLNFLPAYSNDCHAMMEVVKEVDTLFTYLQHHVIQAFVAEQKVALIEEKEFSESILNNSIDGILAYNRNFEITAWNSVLEKQYKLKKEEVIGKSVFEVFPGYAENEVGIAMKKVLQGQMIHFPERPFLFKNGFYEANLVPQRDVNKVVIGGINIIHDITERKKAEMALREHREELQSANEELIEQQEKLSATNKALIKSRDYYLTILEDFPALIWRANTSAMCDYFNRTWLEFTGRPLTQEMGNGWTEGVHPEDMERCLTDYASNFKAKRPFVMEYRLKRHDGKFRWILNLGKPLYDIEGEFIGFLGSCYDIQDKKEAEERINRKNKELKAALEKLKATEEHLLKLNNDLEFRVKQRTKALTESEEELRRTLDQTVALNRIISERENFLSSIIDQTPVPTCIVDAKGAQVRANEAYFRLFGDHGFDKYNIFEDKVLTSSIDYDKIKSVFSEGKIARVVLDFDLSKVRQLKGQSEITVTLITTIFPVNDAHGNIKFAVIKYEDITERKRAEEALKANEAQMRLITDALPVLIAYIDKDERYRFANKAYENWFKKSPEEIYGKKIQDVIGDTAYAPIKKIVRKVLNGEEVYREAFMPYKSAGKKYVAIHNIPHFVNGKVVGYYALINDITKQKEIQRALEVALQETNDKNEELIKINTDLDNFIYIASHDLKSPIVNLEGLMLALNKTIKSVAGESEQRIMDMMSQSIEKFKLTILHLTEVTKAQKNLEEEKELLNFEDVLQEVRVEINEMISASNAQIEENLSEKKVYFSSMNLRSIIYNLLSNAIKYRRPDTQPKIAINTYREGSNIVLSVKDNGLGLTPEQQGKLFTMFKRMHSHVEGSGIGLYILKRIAENNGGKVEVESTLHKGTEFKVYFQASENTQVGS